MSQHYSDKGSSVGSSCSYKHLSTMNTGSKPAHHASSKGHFMVPTYGAPGYNTLNHGVDAKHANCNGHFTISQAYSNGKGNSGKCNQKYVKKMCN